MPRLSPAPKAFLEEPTTQAFMANLFRQIGFQPTAQWFIITDEGIIVDFFPLCEWHTERPLGRQS